MLWNDEEQLFPPNCKELYLAYNTYNTKNIQQIIEFINFAITILIYYKLDKINIYCRNNLSRFNLLELTKDYLSDTEYKVNDLYYHKKFIVIES